MSTGTATTEREHVSQQSQFPGELSGMLTLEPPTFPQLKTITQDQLNNMTRALWLYQKRDVINEEIAIAARGLPAPFAFAAANGGPQRFATSLAAPVNELIANMLRSRGSAMRVGDIAAAIHKPLEVVTETLEAGEGETFKKESRGYWRFIGE